MGFLQLLATTILVVVLPCVTCDIADSYPYCPRNDPQDPRGELCYFLSNTYDYYCCEISGYWHCCRKPKAYVVTLSIIGSVAFLIILLGVCVTFCCGMCCFSGRRRHDLIVYQQHPNYTTYQNEEGTSYATTGPMPPKYSPEEAAPPPYQYETKEEHA